MGMYDTLGIVQIKCGRCAGYHFEVGDAVAKAQIDDGVYVGYGGIVVVVGGVFVAEFEHVTNKWGGTIDALPILNIQNPVAKAIEDFK